VSLFIFAGQSNAIIPGVTVHALPDALRRPDPMVQIWATDHFETLVAGVNTGGPNTPTAVGPEVEFAARWRHDHPDQVLYLIKSAKGSTGLAADPHELDWSPTSPGELFDATTAKIRAGQAALATAGEDPRVTAILWLQGEQDATSAVKAGAYLNNELQLAQAMRTAWASAATPIIFTRLPSGQGLAFEHQVQDAQEAVSASISHMVLLNTDGLSLQPDSLHFDAAGAIGLGDELYAGLAAYAETGQLTQGNVIRGIKAWTWNHGDFLEIP
jgi:hypothetical protein